MKLNILLEYIILLFVLDVVHCYAEAVNLTNFLVHRQKRGLIYDRGTIKMVIGGIYPIYLEDPIKWRQLNCLYNFQGGQYPLPSTPSYPWDKWEHTYGRTLQSIRDEFDRTGHYDPDETRSFTYILFENYMNLKGVNGHECMLKFICENVQEENIAGVFHEMLNVILSPGKEDIEEDYSDAFKAGKAGVDCSRLYPNCSYSLNFVDRMLMI